MKVMLCCLFVVCCLSAVFGAAVIPIPPPNFDVISADELHNDIDVGRRNKDAYYYDKPNPPFDEVETVVSPQFEGYEYKKPASPMTLPTRTPLPSLPPATSRYVVRKN